MRARLVLILCLAIIGVPAGCGRNPAADAQKLVEVAHRHFRSGKYAQASIIYRRALQKDRRLGKAYYWLGLTELKREKPLNAIGSFFRAFELQDGTYDAYEPLAKMLIVSYRTGRASTKHSRAALNELNAKEEQRNPRSKHLPFIRGEMLLADGEPAGAVQMLATALERNPTDHLITLPLFRALEGSGKTAEAEALARARVAQHTDFDDMYDLLCRLLARQNRWSDVEQTRKQQIAASPSRITPRIELATFYLRRGRQDDAKAVLQSILADRKDGYLPVGDFYLRSFDPREAIPVYQQGLQKDPARAETYQSRIVDALMHMGEAGESRKLVDEILRRNPDSARARAVRGMLRFPAEREAGLADLRFAVKTDPNNGALRYMLGVAEQQAGNMKEAELQLNEAGARLPDNVGVALTIAQFYAGTNRLGRAFAIADAIVREMPGNIAARQLRAAIWTEMKLFREARIELDGLLQKNPSDARTVYLRAKLTLAEGDYKAAEARFSKLYQSNPTDARFLQGLIAAYLNSGRAAQADAFLHAELKKYPDRLDLRARIADLALGANDAAEAVLQTEQIAEKRPQDANAWAAMGRARCHAGELEQAEKDLRKALSLEPENLVANTYLGSLLAELGRHKEAIPYLEKALPNAPEEPRVLNDLAYSIAQTGGDLERAVTLAQKAVARMPHYATVSDTLGWVYLKKKLYPEAATVFRRNVEKEPANPTWRYHLALAMIGSGDKAAARVELQAALKSKPSNREKIEIEQLLARSGS